MRDLLAYIQRIPNVMLGNPLGISARVNERPATVRGKLVWPKAAMAERVAKLQRTLFAGCRLGRLGGALRASTPRRKVSERQ